MLHPQIPSPCYVIEERLLRNNLSIIRNIADSADIEIILAFKGFSLWGVFDIVREYIQGASASSLHETMLCVEKMKTKSHTYCVAIAPHEIEKILDNSSHITFNSLNQYDAYHQQALAKNVSIGLRINPQFSKAKTELYNPGSLYSRLGIAPQLLKVLPPYVQGLHFHVLCENNSYDLDETLSYVELHFGHLLPKIKWLNMGGGHLMTHSDYDTVHLISLLKKIKDRYPHLHILLEPSSAFAWQTGFLNATVLDIIDANGIKTLMLDVSFTAHMPDCLEMPYKPTVRFAQKEPDKNSKYTYRLGGTTCLAGDYMSAYGFEKEVHIGDNIILEDMIHYTMVKTSTFNGVTHPSIGLIDLNNNFKLLRQFGYEDFRNKLS